MRSTSPDHLRARTIPVGVWALHTGRVAGPETGPVDLAIDVPSGRVTARVNRESTVGSVFIGTPLYTVGVDGCPQVEGAAYRTGEHVFSIGPRDPLVPGFVLR